MNKSVSETSEANKVSTETKNETGPIDRFATEITTSLIGGGLGMVFAGPAGAAIGACVGAISGAIGQRFFPPSQKNEPTVK